MPAASPPASTSARPAGAVEAEASFQDPDRTDDQLASAQETLDRERERTILSRSTAAPLPSTESGPSIPTASSSNGKKGRKSRTGGGASSSSKESEPVAEDRIDGVAVDEAGPPAKRRKASVPTEAGPTDTTATASATAGTDETNLRLQRLRLSLRRFLDLVPYRVTAEKMAKSLPRLDGAVLDAIRTQFVAQLVEVIQLECENLVEENGLEGKLRRLQELVEEAERRRAEGFEGGEDEVRDVWRADLDIETAISARAIPDQEKRVEALRRELDEIQATNATIHADLKATTAKVKEKTHEAREALDALDAAIKALEASPDMERRLKGTMDAILADMGARV